MYLSNPSIIEDLQIRFLTVKVLFRKKSIEVVIPVNVPNEEYERDTI